MINLCSSSFLICFKNLIYIKSQFGLTLKMLSEWCDTANSLYNHKFKQIWNQALFFSSYTNTNPEVFSYNIFHILSTNILGVLHSTKINLVAMFWEILNTKINLIIIFCKILKNYNDHTEHSLIKGIYPPFKCMNILAKILNNDSIRR